MIRSCLNGWIHKFIYVRSMADNMGGEKENNLDLRAGFKVLTWKPLASAEKKRAMKIIDKQRVPFISLSQCWPQ